LGVSEWAKKSGANRPEKVGRKERHEESPRDQQEQGVLKSRAGGGFTRKQVEVNDPKASKCSCKHQRGSKVQGARSGKKTDVNVVKAPVEPDRRRTGTERKRLKKENKGKRDIFGNGAQWL